MKRTYQPPYHERFREPEFQAHFGRALGLVATAEAALIRRRRGIHGVRARRTPPAIRSATRRTSGCC